jgi:transcriptional regulator with XRE-family HTH domain
MPSRLDPLETEIAARMRRWRRGADFSQTDVATSVGCSRDLFAAYEAARSALPWRTYQKLALLHRLNPDWLYSGAKTPEAPFDMSVLEESWPEKARFSTAWASRHPRAPRRQTPIVSPPSQTELEVHLDRLWTDAIARSPLLSSLAPEAAERQLVRWALHKGGETLAKELGLDRQRLNAWLQGKPAPAPEKPSRAKRT